MSAACRGCTKRHVGCHSTCESYLAYRRELDERRTRKAQQETEDRERMRSLLHVPITGRKGHRNYG